MCVRQPRMMEVAVRVALHSEAARACLALAFATLELEEVVAFTVPRNVRSLAVMRRLGMQRDAHGDFDHPRLPPGHPLAPHVLYRLRRGEWSAAGNL